jgi:hypothetical protein
VKLPASPFVGIDWSRIAPTVHMGERGRALRRPCDSGEFRIRLIEYSPNYVADQWRHRVHVLCVVAH